MPSYNYKPTHPPREQTRPTYQWRHTYMGKKAVSPEIVAAELAKLDATGDLTAERVVEAATPPDAPLHAEFEWDDRLAAHKQRLGEGRAMIRGIEILILPTTREAPKEIRPVYVHVPARNPFQPGTYVTPEVMVQDVTQYERALSEALRMLAGSERYFHFLRSLGEHMPETVQAQLAMAHEAYHFLRQALEVLRERRSEEEAAD